MRGNDERAELAGAHIHRRRAHRTATHQEGKGSLRYFLEVKGWACALSDGVGTGGAQGSSSSGLLRPCTNI